MPVCNWFTIEIYGYTHSLHTFLARALMMPLQWRLRLRTRRIEDNARMSPEYGRRLTAQQKDARRQDNGEGR